MNSMRQTEIIIEPGRAAKNYWSDLWRYRELFYFLAWRDVLVRYKQTTLGIAWAVLRPLLQMLVFTVVFHRIAKLEAPSGVPYPILVYAAMLPWQLFATSLTECSQSLVSNGNLVSKVYFPRAIVPGSSVIVSLVDFFISSALLLVLMAWYRFVPDARVLLLPVFTLFGIGAAMGAGLWLAALNVKYRDFRYVVPFMVQFGLYISPVGFDSSVVTPKYRLLYSLNPMVGVIDGFRWAIVGQELYLPGLGFSVAISIALLLTGVWYFRRTERVFADVI